MALADTHVHLLAGLDDGPDTPAEAVAMCRFLVAEGAGQQVDVRVGQGHVPV